MHPQKRSRLIAALILTAVFLLALFIYIQIGFQPAPELEEPEFDPSPPPEIAEPEPQVIPQPEPGRAPLSIPEGHTRVPGAPERSLLEDLNAPGTTIDDDLELINTALFSFNTVFHQHPLGTHEEIVAALQGENAREIAFIPPDSPHVDDQGRLLDRWGTPFFFHAVSHDRMEILSAGPDGEFYTPDDAISRQYPVHPPIQGEPESR
jgi:hypothetical protein